MLIIIVPLLILALTTFVIGRQVIESDGTIYWVKDRDSRIIAFLFAGLALSLFLLNFCITAPK